METAIVESEKVQTREQARANRIDLFRFQKYVDGEGKLWIITLTFGFDANGRYGEMVQLLDVDRESTIDVKRADVMTMIKEGAMNRVEGPILI